VAKEPNDQYSDKEAARRRDLVVKAMIATPPTPHMTKKKTKKGPATRATARKREAKTILPPASPNEQRELICEYRLLRPARTAPDLIGSN
jgi:hypothetical protein